MNLENTEASLTTGHSGGLRISRSRLRVLVETARAGLAAKRSAYQLRRISSSDAESRREALERMCDCDFTDRVYQALLRINCDDEERVPITNQCLSKLEEEGRVLRELAEALAPKE